MENIILKEREDLEIRNYINNFLNYIDVSDKTIETYSVGLKSFVNYINENNIKKPTREDIINYRESIKTYLKPTTVNSYMIAIRTFYSYLEYEGITKNITKNVKGIKLENKHLKRGLTIEEINKVFDSCKDIRELLLIKLMINCGLRCNEVINIELKDFYNDKGVIMLRVLGKARNGIKQDSIKIDNRLFNLIQEYVNEYGINDYLFTSTSNHNTNGKLTTKTIRYIVTNLFKKANLDMDMLSTHSTRHTTCELLLENGTPIQEVSEYMRHKSLSTTMVYSKELNRRESTTANELANCLF